MARITFMCLFLICWTCFSSFTNAYRAGLKHVDSDGKYTKDEMLKRSVHRSHQRVRAIMARLTNGTNEIFSPVITVHSDYQMNLAIGTPPVVYFGEIDTGSDLVWTQCAPCIDCKPQRTRMYDPHRSSTYSPVKCSAIPCTLTSRHTCSSSRSCQYTYSYGSGSISGELATETFTFQDFDIPYRVAQIPGLIFGCTDINKDIVIGGAAGIIGLSPGSNSLVSQLDIPRFSYCLDPSHNDTGVIVFGSEANVDILGHKAQSTPFVNTGSDNAYYYYLNLTGISLGDTLLPISPSVFQYVPGQPASGTIIDSGTTYTHLTIAAYEAVAIAVIAIAGETAVSYRGLFDVCFDMSHSFFALNLPPMTYHFDGADMVVPYMKLVSRDFYCMEIKNTTGGPSVIGNTQHRNMPMLYDLAAQKLSFVQAQCRDS